MTIRLGAGLLAALAVAGCEPDFLDGQFTCTADDRRCPGGFSCDPCSWLCVRQPGPCADLAAPQDLAVGVGVGDGGCGLRTCESAHAQCGPIGDGCGGLLDCGTCPPPTACGGGGVPFQCGGTGACVPQTCDLLGYACGPAGDGCGGLIDCGTCPPGLSCGGGQVPGQCGLPLGDAGFCSPRTCPQLGFDCGPAGDGCGGLVQCGLCPPGQACGGGGQPGKCAVPISNCKALTCQQLGFNCGMAGDGCGGVFDCGGCALPAICGGGGQPNVCGNPDGVDGGQCDNLCQQVPSCDGGTTTISGTVLAPTDPALGFGDPDPLGGAVVYIPNGPVAEFPKGVTCDNCGANSLYHVSGSPLVADTSGIDGKFTLPNAPCGDDIPLVIQLGRWRRQVVIPHVECCANNPLPRDLTRLPRNHMEGDIPAIAIVTGFADAIECVLPKIGIDPSEFSLPSGDGRVRFYQDNGANFGPKTPNASTLWGDPNELGKYDAVILDCDGSENDQPAPVIQNMVDFANKGGRIFASHYSYVWLYHTVPWSQTANWQPGQNPPNVLTGYIDLGFPKGVTFALWLAAVGASPNFAQVIVQDVRHDANQINLPGQRWIYADPFVSPDTPLEYTFNTPIGVAPDKQCGRVLFSDFHVHIGANAGHGPFPGECGPPSPLTPQEKVLEYMLFDLTSCIQPDTPTCKPLTCKQQKAQCGPVGDGCGNIIQCGDCPPGQLCGLGGPFQCAPDCQPRTCQGQGIGCGPAGDGCGGMIDCGTCPLGQICGGGGAGKCGTVDLSFTCTPLTCQKLSLACGPAGDGCGNRIECGDCPVGQTCGGGGVSGRCGVTPGCTPLTCKTANANCGFVGDGCGAAIDCGKCPANQSCGGGGVPNQCAGVG